MRARRSSGFTLLELLVVVCIITVLATLLLSGLSAARRKAQIAVAKSNLDAIRAGLVAYDSDTGRLPRRPGAATAGTVFQNDIAYVYAALKNRRTAAHGGGPNSPYVDWKPDYIGFVPAVSGLTLSDQNLGAINGTGKLPQTLYEPLGDGDAQQINDPTFQTTHLPNTAQPLVFLDPWGNPYFYREWASVPVAIKDAATRVATSNLGVGGTGAAENHTDKCHDPSKFDIWSFGPNGVNEFGEGDDVTSWGSK